MPKLTRKEEILIVAAELFQKMGYSAVSMRDLAANLGMQPASLYNHINSKQEILSEMVVKLAETYTNGMNRILSKEQKGLDKLKSVIDYHIDINLDNPNRVAALQNDWMHLDHEDKSYVEKMRSDYELNFRAILQQAIDEGDLRPLNVEVAVYYSLTALRTLYRWYNRQKEMERETLKTDIISLLLDGMMLSK